MKEVLQLPELRAFGFSCCSFLLLNKNTMNGIFNPAPPQSADKEASLKDFGTSMNAISFGFVATAILISMFLIMAIFEHLLRPRTSFSQSENDSDEGTLETGQAQAHLCSLEKIRSSQSVATSYPSDLSVMMPGHRYPTYLAQPAPLPCSREGIYWPSHDHYYSFASSYSTCSCSVRTQNQAV